MTLCTKCFRYRCTLSRRQLGDVGTDSGMIRQGIVHEKAADLVAMNQLPPLSMLPQWSRINTLDKARYPKAFIKDKHQAILDEAKQKLNRDEDDDKDIEVTEMNPVQRIQYLERSILFLRQQHHEVLRCLHEEIDNLKKENKGNIV